MRVADSRPTAEVMCTEAAHSERAVLGQRRRARRWVAAGACHGGGNPQWLYLPHLGAGGGADGLVAAQCAKRRRVASPTESAVAAVREAGCVQITGEPSTHARPQRRDDRDGIRGRVVSTVQPPGLPADGGGVGEVPVHSIRGQRPLLGMGECAEANVRDRMAARLAAQNSLIQRSLDDHADRVAKRALSGDAPQRQSAASRLAALRARVSARGGASCSGGPQGAVDNAAVHAATRVALQDVPAQLDGGCRHLSG